MRAARVMLISGFYPPSIGGMEKQLELWAQTLSALVSSVEVHTSAIFSTVSLEYQNRVRITREGRNLNEWSELACQRVALQANSQSVIVIAGVGRDTSLNLLSAVRLARSRGARIVFRIPTSDHLERAAQHPGGRSLLGLVDRYVTNSRSLYGRIRDEAGQVRLISTYLRKDEIVSVDAPYPKRRACGYFGRFSARKRLEIIADIAYSMRRDDIQFCAQGPSGFGEHEYFTKTVRHLESAGVKCHPPAQLPDRGITQAVVFLSPSRAEGCSNSVLEAMNRGSVPVVSNISENQTLVGDVGLSCDSVEDYVRAIRQVFYDSETPRRQGRARIRASGMFSEKSLAHPLEMAILRWSQ